MKKGGRGGSAERHDGTYHGAHMGIVGDLSGSVADTGMDQPVTSLTTESFHPLGFLGFL